MKLTNLTPEEFLEILNKRNTYSGNLSDPRGWYTTIMRQYNISRYVCKNIERKFAECTTIDSIQSILDEYDAIPHVQWNGVRNYAENAIRYKSKVAEAGRRRTTKRRAERAARALNAH